MDQLVHNDLTLTQGTVLARPLEFDREQALAAALRLFWYQGYGSTSLQQLLTGMSISRSSFYAAFGDKRALFVEVLSLFADRTLAILNEAREQHGSSGAIPVFFRYTVLDVPRRRSRRGCLMVNTLLELAEVDDELSRYASDSLGRIERGFEHCVRDAQSAGDIPAVLPPSLAARQLMLVNQGLRVASREHRSRRELAEMISTSLSLLGFQVAA